MFRSLGRMEPSPVPPLLPEQFVCSKCRSSVFSPALITTHEPARHEFDPKKAAKARFVILPRVCYIIVST